MIVYWILFSYFAVAAIGERPTLPRNKSSISIALAAILLTAIIGLRFQVGGDWGAYERMFSFAGHASLRQMMEIGDPAYQVLNWVIQRAGFDLWAVNLMCGAIFSWGLARFASTQQTPWAVMLTAVPYLVIVVAMGYTRQAVAIGFLMAGLAAFLRGSSIARFTLYVVVAALFHKTAVVALLLVIVSAKRNLLLNFIFILAAGVLLYDFLLADSVENLVKVYVDAEMKSQGAIIRLGMSIVPAILFLSLRGHFRFSLDEDRLWRNFSYATLGLAIALATLPSSTVVDRLALYVLPLQLAIIGRIPGHLIHGAGGQFVVVLYAFSIQYVWLNYAAHAYYWVPYNIWKF